jgi:large subunit ribosomal protein L10
MLTREQKESQVSELKGVFEKSSLIFFSDYKGMTVAQMNDLRGRIRGKYGDNAKYRVVKNTIINLALKGAGYDPKDVENDLKGPTAVLFVENDNPIEAIKIVVNFSKERQNKSLPAFKGGFVEGKSFKADDVEMLSKIPGRTELLSMLVRDIQSPIRGLVTVLAGMLKKPLYALNAIKDKKSGEDKKS